MPLFHLVSLGPEFFLLAQLQGPDRPVRWCQVLVTPQSEGWGGISQGSGEGVLSLLLAIPLMFGRLLGSNVTGALPISSGQGRNALSRHSFCMDVCPCLSIW